MWNHRTIGFIAGLAVIITLLTAAAVPAFTVGVGAPVPASAGPDSALLSASGRDAAPPAQSTGQDVTVRVTVKAVRLLVIDASGRILQIWSNTGARTEGFAIAARLGSAAGPPVQPLPGRTQAEYRDLERWLDWSVRGLVYTAD